MKVLFVSLNFAPELTATGKFTGEMAGWFAGRGHSVDAIAGLPHYPEWRVRKDYRRRGFRRDSSSGVSVMRVAHTVPRPNSVSAVGRIMMETTFSIASLFWWSSVLLRPRKYDVVIAVCPPMQDAVMPWLYGLIRRVPWVVHIQDFQVDAAMRLRMLRVGVLGRLLYAIENFLLTRASRVSTITPAMLKRAVEKGCDPERTWLVPNWADVSGVVPGPRQNAFRRELNLTDDQILVLYAGGMGVKQGLEVVVQVAARLRDDKRLRFAMVGTGADRSCLEAMAAASGVDNLQFLSVQPAERLSEMLAAGDIHLVIQRAEAADLVMPSKLANILAAGRPALATASPGTALHDILHGYDCGVTVEPENVDELAHALLDMAADHSARRRMGVNARAYAEKYLSRDAILGRFEEQLFDLLKEGSRA
ncbi:WcaI family glycosyltransferase [Fontimonas sp. SYSU GA230001]|uniref:WcaI family glycosyltransferase n=1 Tax=Fontimonas sp. SYSU GA230001 TaxID=3142450 RepID=UPI0032B39935